MNFCQALKKSKKICGAEASYQREGYHLCSRHLTQYEKGKTIRIRSGGQPGKIRKEFGDEFDR